MKTNFTVLLIPMICFLSIKLNSVTQYHPENHEGKKENREKKRKREERVHLFFLLLRVCFLFRSLQNLLKILSTLSPIILINMNI
jgi:hypothetical protein